VAQTEAFVVLALPHSVSADAPFHVSLFVSPKLASTDADPKLRDFGPFRRWARQVTQGRITLSDQAGDIPCTARVGAIEPALWPKVFPPSTPVAGQQVPDWSNRPFRSFDTRNVTSLAKAVQATSILASPTAAPTPAAHPLTAPMLRFTERYRVPDPRFPERPWRPQPPLAYDESLATRDLDEILIEGKAPDGFVGQGHELSEQVASIDVLPARMAWELHQARRFYERPESEQRYLDRPDPERRPLPSLPKKEPEFHERCATVGDHPALLRKLGLVVDLEVDDVTRLATSTWLQGSIEVPGALCQRTRVLCRTTPDEAFVTVAAGDDWSDGALTIGRTDRFQVLDVDADGSALKTERYFWSIPRLNQIEENGDDITAASPALRSAGFTISRTGQSQNTQDRLDTQQGHEAGLAGGKDELQTDLNTEDVTRGMRVEVWDDHTKVWRSLHQRLSDVSVTGFGKVLDGLEDEGFTQGTSATETPDAAPTDPVYIHEAMFGWEGWSLSAPRPQLRVRHATPKEQAGKDNPTEVVEKTPTDPKDEHRKPPHPITFTNHAAPGSLPRLRFGRNYAFRVWQVDLAGNSRPHDLDPASAATPDEAAAAVAKTVQDRNLNDAPLWDDSLRQAIREAAAAHSKDPRPQLQDYVAGLGGELLARLITSRLDELRAGRATLPGLGASVSRHTRVADVAATAVAASDTPLVMSTGITDHTELGQMVAAHLSTLVTEGTTAQRALDALATVTWPRPFLRWDPVQPPAVVARRAFTDGESLRVVVIRSGVTQDRDTGTITVTDPGAYATSLNGHPTYRATSQRHLAPPKTTQITAELHGMFDVGIGDSAAEKAKANAMLAWALTENGSLTDRDRADLDDPTHRIQQPGVALAVSSPVPQAKPKKLPLDPGEPPAPGQYIIHDTDELTLPYLPDPLADGVSMVFPDAGRDRPLPSPFGTEGVTAPYLGQWPQVEPFRLVAEGADRLGGRIEGRTMRFRLPAAHVQRVLLSSTLQQRSLALLGPWRTVSSQFTNHPEVLEAAVDGWLWGLTPSESMVLVHAVPRPLEAPRPTTLKPWRRTGEGDTTMTLLGGLDVHGPSTDSVTGEASWSEVVDDVALPGPTSSTTREVAFTTRIAPEEDIAVLAGAEVPEVDVEGFGPVALHDLTHRFHDTHHRDVTYIFRASTRFREYFDPALLSPPPTPGPPEPTRPVDDGKSVVSKPVTIDIPSSARPAAPIVHSVLPLFRWDRGTELEQPLARRHVRRAGVRIYLERPWYSSGDGELLAVLLADGGSDEAAIPPPEDGSGFPYLSKVGGDPIWWSSEVGRRPMSLLQLDNLLVELGLDDRTYPAHPDALPPDALPLASLGPAAVNVRVAGYRPTYNADRKLWYVDVAIDPAHTAWSFLRLAVARYQPSSIDGCHLSAPVRCDYVQLPPERTLTVSRTDASHARVVLSGPVGTRSGFRGPPEFPAVVDQHRVVIARLQRRRNDIGTDLGWTTVATEKLPIRGADSTTFEVAWTGELDAGTDIGLRTPPSGTGGSPAPAWRVTVEEWERFQADALSTVESGPVIVATPVTEQRLVFADAMAL
jgi:hypothetical protein